MTGEIPIWRVMERWLFRFDERRSALLLVLEALGVARLRAADAPDPPLRARSEGT